MGRAFNLASLLNGSGLVSLTSKVTGSLPNDNIAAMAASKLTGQVPDANAPSGSVIQVASTQITSSVTVSHSSSLVYSDVPSFTISITPSNSSNKILILAMVSVASMTSSGDRTYLRLLRNSTAIAIGDSASPRIQVTAEFWNSDGTNTVNQCINWLDSPATTSSVTYKFQCATNAGSGSSIFNMSQRSSALSQDQTAPTQILALEIAA